MSVCKERPIPEELKSWAWSDSSWKPRKTIRRRKKGTEVAKIQALSKKIFNQG